MTASQDGKNSDLFNWVSEVWEKVLFQPDDEIAVNTFQKYFAKDIVIKLAAFALPRHVSTQLLYRWLTRTYSVIGSTTTMSLARTILDTLPAPVLPTT